MLRLLPKLGEGVNEVLCPVSPSIPRPIVHSHTLSTHQLYAGPREVGSSNEACP